jgi:3-deoxy-D-manno-octulosonic-acid transferase
VLVGPHTENFAQAVLDALEAGAIERAADPAEAVARALQWLEEPGQAARMGEAARHWVGRHAGAVARVLDGIEQLMHPAGQAGPEDQSSRRP